MIIDLPSPLSLEYIAKATDAKLHQSNAKIYIKRICTHSSEAKNGTLFIALHGKEQNTELYVSEAIDRGGYALCHTLGKNRLTVKNTENALLKLASKATEDKNIPIRVGITGSVGKTTTKNMLTHILSASLEVHSTEGNFNNTLGLPITLLKAKNGTEAIICEMGMNSQGEISALSKCMKPTIGVITKIGLAHIGMLGNRQAIADAKAEIQDGMDKGAIFVPGNEPLLSHLLNVRTVSSNSNSGDCRFYMDNGSYSYRSSKTSINGICPRFTSPHILECLAFCVSVATELEMEGELIKRQVESLDSHILRHSVKVIRGVTVINDSYNSSPEALESGLKMLEDYVGVQKILCLGDMLELGDYSVQLHKKAGINAKRVATKAYYKGVYSEYFKSGYGQDAIISPPEETKDELAKRIVKDATPGSVIYFKASHALGFGELVSLVEGGLASDE